MEYKRLNKVKIIKNNGEKKFDKYIGKTATILKCTGYKDYILDIEGGTWWRTDEFELINQFTKSDLKDNHIVVYENGYKEIWCQNPNKNIVNENLSSSTPIFTDIVEVWEFDKLIWKREEQILDEVEKKWLRDVIRPFRDRVGYIKLNNYLCEEQVFIAINIKGESSTYFPCFKKGTMYKNMEIGKEYSLKELGLE